MISFFSGFDTHCYILNILNLFWHLRVMIYWCMSLDCSSYIFNMCLFCTSNSRYDWSIRQWCFSPTNCLLQLNSCKLIVFLLPPHLLFHYIPLLAIWLSSLFACYRSPQASISRLHICYNWIAWACSFSILYKNPKTRRKISQRLYAWRNLRPNLRPPRCSSRLKSKFQKSRSWSQWPLLLTKFIRIQ